MVLVPPASLPASASVSPNARQRRAAGQLGQPFLLLLLGPEAVDGIAPSETPASSVIATLWSTLPSSSRPGTGRSSPRPCRRTARGTAGRTGPCRPSPPRPRTERCGGRRARGRPGRPPQLRTPERSWRARRALHPAVRPEQALGSHARSPSVAFSLSGARAATPAGGGVDLNSPA